ncbi:hypothetical protein F4825DRAFT_419946 [Nemania diffusa]|nr:hypothetical protein F4825DRAFT_419946 [Nemania diffusa]
MTDLLTLARCLVLILERRADLSLTRSWCRGRTKNGCVILRLAFTRTNSITTETMRCIMYHIQARILSKVVLSVCS